MHSGGGQPSEAVKDVLASLLAPPNCLDNYLRPLELSLGMKFELSFSLHGSAPLPTSEKPTSVSCPRIMSSKKVDINVPNGIPKLSLLHLAIAGKEATLEIVIRKAAVSAVTFWDLCIVRLFSMKSKFNLNG